MIIHKRKPLSRREFGFLIIDQDGKCGCGCGEKLDFTKPRAVTDEHLRPLREGGSNELHNRQLWLTKCTKPKTGKEQHDRAKAARHEEQRTQADKRKRNGSKLQSRGFSEPPENYVSPLSKNHPNYRGKMR